MSTLRLEVDEALQLRILQAQREAVERTPAGQSPPSLADVVTELLRRGLAPATPTAPEDRALSSITVRELADMLGVTDMAAARQAAAAERAKREEIARRVMVLFADMEAVQVAEAPVRLFSVADLERWAAGKRDLFRDRPSVTIAVAYAVVDPATGFSAPAVGGAN